MYIDIYTLLQSRSIPSAYLTFQQRQTVNQSLNDTYLMRYTPRNCPAILARTEYMNHQCSTN